MSQRIRHILDKLPQWLLTAVTVAAILWLTLAPKPLGDMEPPLFPGADKLAHAIMFGGLALVIFIDRTHKGSKRVSRRFAFFTFIICTLFGITIEYLQSMMQAGRGFEISDMIADGCSALLTSIFWLIFNRKSSSKINATVEDKQEPDLEQEAIQEPPQKVKKHLIKPRWLRILLKFLCALIIFILCVPILLYIPPVQTLVKNIACSVVKKSTGMNISVDSFRLKFPLDVDLKDVLVIEATGDTMVRASEAIADVKLLPLLRLDVKLNRLQLLDGYYRMVSPDSSMILSVKAGYLDVDDKSSANLASSQILLNRAKLRDGNLQLYMNVWKKDTLNTDTATSSTPFYIKAENLDLENFTFGMSMLPTIDTLALKAHNISLKHGVVDLGKNLVTWQNATVSDGNATYVTPTPEYIATHPAPPSQPSSGPPMQIAGDSISLSGFNVLYAVKDATPQPGFDASYIQVNDVAIGMRNFYNESATVRLPITRLEATERSGLQIVQGSGLVAVDSIGLTFRNLDVKTLWSRIAANADIPFALMQLEPTAALNVNAEGAVGLPDVDAFMPSLKQYTSLLPARNPLTFNLKADGTLQRVEIERLDAAIEEILNLSAHGYAANALDMKRLQAYLNFNGRLSNPKLADRLLGMKDISVPAFTLKGYATADKQNYSTNFSLLTSAGNLVADASAGLNSENYNINADIRKFNVAGVMPSIGIGTVSAKVSATGAGFNPLSGNAHTHAKLDVAEIEYNHRTLRDIFADIVLSADGNFNIVANSANPGLDLDINGNGMIKKDDYIFDIEARLRDINLQTLGLDTAMNCGSGNIRLTGEASPARWIYNAQLNATQLDWNLPDMYIHLPQGVTARLDAGADSTFLCVNSLMTDVDFSSPVNLKYIVDDFTRAGNEVMRQIASRSIDVDTLGGMLPRFHLDLTASGRGLLGQLMPEGMALDTIYGSLRNDSLLNGKFNAFNFRSSSIDLDTITLTLKERGDLLDYRLHVGNRPGTFDDFARVNLNGYLGVNRVSAYLNQNDLAGKTGYRLGVTAALVDSLLSVHFTPLKSTIAYMPWRFNEDNFVEYNIYNRHIDANLEASSRESSILLRTEMLDDSRKELHAKIDNLHIEDFLGISMFAPPITGTVNTDLNLFYDEARKRMQGTGTLGVNDLTYNKRTVGSFDMDLNAGYALDGTTDVNAAMRINGDPALALYAKLRADSVGLQPDSVGLELTQFPVKIANPFLNNMVVLGGRLNGRMRMDGTLIKPILNGGIAFDSVTAYVPMAGSTLRFDKDSVAVTDNIVKFNKFSIYGANANPLTIDGEVNAKSFSDIWLDLKLAANNFQPIGNTYKAKSDIYGKLFLDLNATVKGPMKLLDIKANANILGTTDITYNLGMAAAEYSVGNTEDVVKFVNFNDTTSVAQADSIVPAMNMRINANLAITPGAKATVLIDMGTAAGNGRVEVQPTANLVYSQNFMGDMKLNGTVTTGKGFVRYSIPVIGEKMFDFEPESSITWNGPLMNPALNIIANDEMKANVTQDGSSRLANFIVSLHVGNTLSAPSVAFDLSTNDDLSLQNELQSMSADQRQTQAMNLLLTGQYSGMNTKGTSNLNGNMLYGFLESQLNSWAAKTIKGVDLSFGIDQYDQSRDGQTSTETSYSYQVSKSLFNNRFKIQVGGNYSTDASADENLSQNLVSDVSLEYIIKQTQTTDMSARVFRHTGYESILEGEITEMGAGFLFKRKIDDLFRIIRKKEDQTNEEKK